MKSTIFCSSVCPLATKPRVVKRAFQRHLSKHYTKLAGKRNNFDSFVRVTSRICTSLLDDPPVDSQTATLAPSPTASGDSTPLPPAILSPTQAQDLVQLQVSDVYSLGIVSSPEALAAALVTDPLSGLLNSDSAALAKRAAVYGTNSVPPPTSATFLELLLEATGDFTVLVLLAAGTASLTLEYWLAAEEGTSANWIEGASILAAVAVVVLVTAGNNWQKERQFRELQVVQAEGRVRALRGGLEAQLSTSSVLVGDLVLVEAGDILCADGVLVGGTDIKVDESHLTGEADDVAKDPQRAQAMYGGSKVVSGFGRMIVTAVGPRSQSGKIASMIAAAGEANPLAKLISSGPLADGTPDTTVMGALREETALQKKLAGYAATIGRFGLVAAVVASSGLAARFSYDTFYLAHQPWDWAYLHEYLNFFITGVTILVVAVPEGLPLAVAISLAYSVMRMLEQNNLVRHLGAAEAMATTTVICTDKTGTLTQNRMAVTKLWLAGEDVSEVARWTSTSQPSTATRDPPHWNTVSSSWGSGDEFEFDAPVASAAPASTASTPPTEFKRQLLRHVSPKVLSLLSQGIALNCTANLYVDSKGRQRESGNRTEIALLQLAQAAGVDVPGIKCDDALGLVAQAPFSSERKRMTTVIAEEGKGIVHVKGAAEIVIELCRWWMTPDGKREELSAADRVELLQSFQGGGLRLLALASRAISMEGLKDKLGGELPDGLISDVSGGEEPALGRGYFAGCGCGTPVLSEAALDALEQELTLIAVVGMEDPLRPEATEAIAACQRAGIAVKMLTGDNSGTASDIAQQCGILPKNSSTRRAAAGEALDLALGEYAVMEGQQFRDKVLRPDGSVDAAAFLEVWPQLRVLARCTPADKFTIVTAVRGLTSDRVAMTGDGTNDAPALRAANVGFAMFSGTKVAQDAADIVLVDDNFASTVVAALWGRNVYANVARFLQFQLTINTVAVTTAVGGALAAAESPLSAVQMLWVNLIMDSLASLALATEPPDEALLSLPPYTENYQFLDPDAPMLKHVVGQAAYQLGVLAWLLTAAPAALGFAAHITGEGPSVHHTLVFNAFVMMQLFNQVNARKVADAADVGEGLGGSGAGLFMAVLGAEAVLQAVIVEWGGAAFSTVPLSAGQWGLCVGFGAGSLLVRQVLRRVPHQRVWAALKPLLSGGSTNA